MPAGEIEVMHKECVAQGEEGAAGAHYTTGIIRYFNKASNFIQICLLRFDRQVLAGK